jgi:hypothetical protein
MYFYRLFIKQWNDYCCYLTLDIVDPDPYPLADPDPDIPLYKIKNALGPNQRSEAPNFWSPIGYFQFTQSDVPSSFKTHAATRQPQ